MLGQNVQIRVADSMMNKLMVPKESRECTNNVNSVYMMADSGAKRFSSSIKAISGMRGLWLNHPAK